MLADTNVTTASIVFRTHEVVTMGIAAHFVLAGTLCRGVLVAVRKLAALAARRCACISTTCATFAASEIVAVCICATLSMLADANVTATNVVFST